MQVQQRVTRYENQRKLSGLSKSTESFGTLSVEGTTDYDAATQVGRSHWYISAPGRPDAWALPLDLRNIFPRK